MSKPAKPHEIKNVLITGATDGVGLLLAQEFVKEGARVVVTGRRTIDQLARDTLHGMAYVQADQRDPAAAERSIRKALERMEWDRCDIAVLNAGMGWTGNPLEEPASSIRDVINTNLTAHVMIARLLAPYLLSAKDGHLTIIGSTAHTGSADFASYTASKAGLHGFVRSLREEWRGRAKVQIIHPGPIATDMHGKAGFDAAKVKRYFLNPCYVARAIRFAIRRGQSPLTINHFSRGLDILTFGWMWRR